MAMTDPVELRIRRLEAIADSLRDSGRALALLALGSAGDTARLDRWSDLDFFAIVREGEKRAFIEDLWWLRAAGPIGWCYRNTVDGWKALYEDGVFLEFAVFEPGELAAIPFAPGRIVWQADGFDAALTEPRRVGGFQPADPDWLAGEILSNLYIGLARWRRGERLAGMRSIQVHALDNLLRLAEQTLPPAPDIGTDPFNPERRVERRHPDLAILLPDMAAGLAGCPRAARAILSWLERHATVPDAIRREILELAAD